MITLQPKLNNKWIEISGAPSDVMLFYCLWMFAVWPDWMSDSANPEVIEEAKKVSGLIREGHSVLLCNDTLEFQVAFDLAVSRCERLEIDVRELQPV